MSGDAFASYETEPDYRFSAWGDNGWLFPGWDAADVTFGETPSDASSPLPQPPTPASPPPRESSSPPGGPPLELGFCCPPGAPALSCGGRPRKPNKVRKGEGRDSKKDEWDDYSAVGGHFYQVLLRGSGRPPIAAALFALCAALEKRLGAENGELSKRNRWAKRRVANAYAWLDRNAGSISDATCLECYLLKK
jgi:hypothetical protein